MENINKVLNILGDFISWKESLRKEYRGGKKMYDIKGHYKFLHENELFSFWENNLKGL